MRIRWRGVARIAAILLVGLVALRLLPGFLRAPEPPPPAADVGLPKAEPVSEVPRGGAAKPVTDAPARRAKGRSSTRPRGRRRRSRGRSARPRPVRDAAASTAVIDSKRRHRLERSRPRTRSDKIAKPASRPEKAAGSTPPPAPGYAPPAAPEAIPEPLPEPATPAPSTPGDGSQEFAPH